MKQLGPKKFEVELSSPEGNVFFLLKTALDILKSEGKTSEYQQLMERVLNASSYEEAVSIIAEYGVEFQIIK